MASASVLGSVSIDDAKLLPFMFPYEKYKRSIKQFYDLSQTTPY